MAEHDNNGMVEKNESLFFGLKIKWDFFFWPSSEQKWKNEATSAEIKK